MTRTSLTAEALADLHDVAKRAQEADRDGGWYDPAFLAAFIDGDDEQVIPAEDAALIAAASPDVILALVAAARREARLQEALQNLVLSVRERPRSVRAENRYCVPWHWIAKANAALAGQEADK